MFSSPTKIVIIAGALLVLLVAIILWATRVTHLDPPLIRAMGDKVGKEAVISGIAYPGAKLAVYLDDEFVQDTTVNDDGDFELRIGLAREQLTHVKAKQLYGNITSEFSEQIEFDVDLTPPDKNTLRIGSEIPSFSKETSLTVKGSAEPGDVVVVNNVPHTVSTDGQFTADVALKNGSNTLRVELSDNVDNRVDIDTFTVEVDSIAPRVGTSWCSSANNDTDDLGAGQEYVCVSTGQWEDWRDPAPIPIVGYVRGEIGSITVDGKRIYPDENNEIYQRVSLAVPKGLNKYKVVVTDKHGNTTTTNLSMTVSRVDNNSYDEVIDRLDDIESQL